MEEQKEYDYTGFLVLKKKKKAGVLRISEGKIAFYQGYVSLIEWNQVLMQDIVLKCTDVPIRKLLFAKPENSLILMYKNSSLMFINEMHSYEEMMHRISDIKAVQTEKMAEEKKTYDECYRVLSTCETLNNRVQKSIAYSPWRGTINTTTI